ncbi:MAG: double-strand break repair protein AddB, partial [Alphaproteobacteria bacterium]|nr:double-strand break repair protein AddB [Alphaproteobacteria bacterium]
MAARVFNIPTGIPFADALAAGLLHRHGGDPDALGRVTVLLPTRRACRSLREAFLRVHSGALMLPLLRPLGDVEEDALAISGTGDYWQGDANQALDMPPAITPLRRQMMLARLVMQNEVGMVPDRALFLASELGTLLDLMQTEEIGFEALADIVPANLAEHWQKTLKFMELVTENWPEILAEDGSLDPAERRKLLMKAQADHWRATPPSDPVYAAGSTGTVPATAELMAVIGDLANGAIVLPGLDVAMEPQAWDAIEATHPQATMKHLIGRLGVDRHDVGEWEHPLEGPQNRAETADRVALVAQALRPAAAWQAPKPDGQNETGGAQISGLHYMECAGPEYEARAIAVVLREALETPKRTAALVTPDRDLARRVAAELTRWGLKIDDSAGVPLAQTPVGSFLRLTADMIVQQIAPVPLLAALKHPLACGGTDGGTFRAQVRRLERAVLRGTRPTPGFDGLDRALKSLKKPRPDLRDWLKPIAAAGADFESEIAKKGDGDLAKLVRAHVQFAEFLAGTEVLPGDQRLWAHG